MRRGRAVFAAFALATGSIVGVAACIPGHAHSATPKTVMKADKMFELTVKTIDGTEKKLADYKGKALLIVNTASQCGYTPQYAGLQELYEEYKDKGFEVLGFPSNDFGGQEPGSEAEIKTFCERKYKTTFPMFAKVKALNPGKSPLYAFLTEQTPEGVKGDVRWNFTKFLIAADGTVAGRFESGVKPTDPELMKAVEKALPAK